ncbi:MULTISPECIES: hypothetical protein [Lacticaseibacillus]|uniref:Uncharacterized protein n=2 Tax=Lacticaseibacillus TaxID=2759736 RepID=A0AAN1KEW7_LACCA|nr:MULTISPECIES: hypothetical protein [Lacticaseibacillus]ARY92228.1 hypothetical protein BGL52_10875 [Lacticaseibacillus casei]KAB1971279.1 hypothetical protein F9B82_01985 [Lacticaseibacillus casei]WLV80135.1 hypothetical protein LACSTY_002186 [Lacticaseibacillus sp. NCIMB 15473]WNX24094.1 hypothetical protein RWA15_10650 [Lacticaseibacillus casei]WNX26868.1 hypothetical protein RWA16_10655 [Lacticaseibacillus casei]
MGFHVDLKELTEASKIYQAKAFEGLYKNNNLGTKTLVNGAGNLIDKGLSSLGHVFDGFSTSTGHVGV